MLAAGQVAAGLLGAAGQLAVAPHALGMVTDTGLFVAAGLADDGDAARRRRRPAAAAGSGSLLDTPSPTRIASVRDGRAHVAAEVVSDDQLRAPLSSRPCVFWHTVHVGPAMREHERSGGNVMIGDAIGQASRRLRQRGHLHPQRQLPRDRGPGLGAAPRDVARARRDAARRGTGHDDLRSSRRARPSGAACRPCSRGGAGAPLIVTTRNPLAIRTELRFAAAFAWTLVASGVFAAFSWALLL